MSKCCNYPKHENNEIFSLQNKYNYYLNTNTTHSLLGEWEECSTAKDVVSVAHNWCAYLPMGRTCIALNERQTIVENGVIIWQNKRTKNNINLRGVDGSYAVIDEQMKMSKKTFFEKQDALDYATIKSIKYRAKYLVIRCLGVDFWG